MKENIFRCFGISKEDVKTLLSPLLENTNGVFVDVSERLLLVDITLKADDSNLFIYEFTRLIYENLGEYIYAESNLTIEEVALQLLKINKLKIATAEDLTAGQIICNLVKNDNQFGNVIVEGVVPLSNHAKSRLNISKNELDQCLTSPIQRARNLAFGLLNQSTADVVVSTTGAFDEKTEYQNNIPVFVAIGTNERVDVYKNTLSGTKSEIIDLTSNLALFYLIKKLRNFNSYLENN